MLYGKHLCLSVNGRIVVSVVKCPRVRDLTSCSLTLIEWIEHSIRDPDMNPTYVLLPCLWQHVVPT